jgi:trigger factor
VEIPAEAVDAELERTFRRLQAVVAIPGFRRGRVPRRVLERYLGGQLQAEVLSELVDRSYGEAIERAGIRPVTAPEIVPESIHPGSPLRYTATVEVLPEIEIEQFEGLPARRPRRLVTDRDVDEAIEQVRESLAELRPIEDREEPRAGDLALVDWSISIEGQPQPPGAPETRLVELGKGALPRPVEEALGTMKVGESREVDVEVSPPGGDPGAPARRARFRLTLRGLRERVRPPLDDELAREHGECETLEELRSRIRQRLEERFAAAAEEAVREQLLDELLRRHPFEAPAALVERETERLVREIAERTGLARTESDADPDRLARLAAEVRPRAERRVKAVLALDALARRLGIAVSESDLEEAFARIARSTGREIEKIRAAYSEAAALEDLRRRIARERALARVVASARIEEVDAIGEGVVADLPETS